MELTEKDLGKLVGVHPNLVILVKAAAQLCPQPFRVQEGLRSLETQREYLAKGVTRTLNSKHLKQTDGFGHAVDLVPLVGGEPRWEWPLIYPIAWAMAQATKVAGFPLTWGGVWDRPLRDYAADLDAVVAEVQAYCVRHPGPDFIDGPHYQLEVE